MEISKEIIFEADRFEAKLREMFGFSVQVSGVKLFLFRSLICTDTRRNPAACGKNQGNSKLLFAFPRAARARGEIIIDADRFRGLAHTQTLVIYRLGSNQISTRLL